MKKKLPIPLTVAVAVLLVLGIVLNVAVYGFLADVLTMRFGKATAVAMSEEEKAGIRSDARALAAEIARDGIVLLNNNGTLPYTDESKKVDILGCVGAYPYYGGVGSGGISDDGRPVDFRAAFEAAGWTVNQQLISVYAPPSGDQFTLSEPSPDSYWDKTDSSADLAVVVLGRTGGENYDLPTSGYGPDGAGHYLALSENELELIRKAAKQYRNVAVVINSANPMELGAVEELISEEAGAGGNVDAVLWIGKPGYYGISALVEIIEGGSPSGRLTDSYAYDLFSAPATKAYGDNEYTNITIKSNAAGIFDPKAHYQEYAEGIFVGYRYYETAAELGYINYEETVQYPFGYGLSYTDFSWEVISDDIPETVRGDTSFSVTVRVTNTGDVPGKEVVQLYLLCGKDSLLSFRLDHSAAALIAFGKTGVIEPGSYEDVVLQFSAEDIASYDGIGAYSEQGSYVIESGDYTFALRTDSHTDKSSALRIPLHVEAPIVYGGASDVSEADTSASKRPSDAVTVNNVFGPQENSTLNGSAYGAEVRYLSVSSSEEDWLSGTGRTGDREAPQALADFIADGANVSVENKGYSVLAEPVVTEKDSGLAVSDLTDTAYDDPKWQALVEQMSVSELSKLILGGGYKTDEIASVGKAKTVDADGPCGIYYYSDPAQYPGISYPAPVLLAATFDPSLAQKFGASVAREAAIYGIGSWYAPGANLHRTAFGGRNFEYYSEDPVLSGHMAMQTCAAAADGGLIVYLKHFVLNETELNRNNNVVHWCTEQALRELYLKAFEYPVKAQERFGLTSVTGMMSAFNYIGDRWCGASAALLTTILRGEWGFEGTVITDYFGGYGYMDADCAIRAGNDLMLNTIVAKLSRVSEDDKQYMQRAAKNILYTYSRSGAARPLAQAGGLEPWQVAGIVINIVWWTITVLLAILCAVRWNRIRSSSHKEIDQ